MEVIINPTKVNFYTFFLEIHGDENESSLNLESVVKHFELDVYSIVDKEKGLLVKQKDTNNTIKSAFDICSSTRKINKEQNYSPSGFTKILFPQNSFSINYMNPQEIIPNGGYCKTCYNVGPNGHKNECSKPVMQDIRLTLSGLISCVYSIDKNLRTIIKNDDTINDALQSYMDKIKEYEKTDYNDDVYLKAANDLEESKKNILFDYVVRLHGSDDIATKINYSVIRKFQDQKFFPGCVELQYHDKNHNKVSIRIYEKKFVIVSCPSDSEKFYIINEIVRRLNNIPGQKFKIKPKPAIIKYAKGKFNIYSDKFDHVTNLDSIYSYFHPVDQAGQPINNVDGVKKTIYTGNEDSPTINTFIVSNEDDIYFKYTINEPKKGKMSFKDLIRTKLQGDILNFSEYKITAQIYSTGVIQLIFSYVTKDESNILYKLEDIDRYLNIISTCFDKIKDLFVFHYNNIKIIQPDAFFIDQEKNKISKHIHNTVSGIIPYSKAKFGLGNVIELFDYEEMEWTGKYAFIVYIKKVDNNLIYGVTFDQEFNDVIDESDYIQKGNDKFSGGIMTLPLVSVSGGNKAYLLDSNNIDGNFTLVSADNVSEYDEDKIDDFRIYKLNVGRSVYKNSSQVCPKTHDGVAIQPIPYSFYGRCPSGKNQYIDITGVRSRNDQLFYPKCTNISAKNKEEIQNKFISFILNGPSEIEKNQGKIKIGYLHNERIDDLFSGILIPGTTNIGNQIKYYNYIRKSWQEGIIKHVKKSHGDGSGLVYIYVADLDVDDEEDEIDVDRYIDNDSKFEGEDVGYRFFKITGKDLHPKHRESRNFKGLNFYLKTDKEKIDFLIDCAKKLNLVRPNLPKNDVAIQNRVIANINKLTGGGVSYRCVEPFVNKYIKYLTKYPYVATFIPSNSIRCLLYINDSDNIYIVESETNKVMRVNIVVPDNYSGILIDGYIDPNSFLYYPIDLLYFNGKQIKLHHINGNDPNKIQKLNEIINNCEHMIGAKDSLKFDNLLLIGPTDPNESLLSYIKNNKKNNYDIVFIPQNKKSCFLYWNYNIKNNNIVLQILQMQESNTLLTLGIMVPEEVDGKIKYTGMVPVSYKMKIYFPIKDDKQGVVNSLSVGDCIQFRFNIMQNGELNKNDPYVDIVKVGESSLKSYEYTKLQIASVVYNVKPETFNNENFWSFPANNLFLTHQSNSTLPLIETNNINF
jgi:hypothetical protein